MIQKPPKIVMLAGILAGTRSRVSVPLIYLALVDGEDIQQSMRGCPFLGMTVSFVNIFKEA